jgi:hypothetical protein
MLKLNQVKAKDEAKNHTEATNIFIKYMGKV